MDVWRRLFLRYFQHFFRKDTSAKLAQYGRLGTKDRECSHAARFRIKRMLVYIGGGVVAFHVSCNIPQVRPYYCLLRQAFPRKLHRK